jgi:hypothetical protein
VTKLFVRNIPKSATENPDESVPGKKAEKLRWFWANPS